MDLLVKCALAVLIMCGVHYIAKTNNYYIAGLVLSFPGLSILAYYFMYLEHGAAKVRETITFAMASAIPFLLFLLLLNITLKNHSIMYSLLLSSGIWAVLSSVLIMAWRN